MPYIPSISNYKPFYIQTDADGSALDTASQWGLIAKANPYPLLPTPKEPYMNDWHDEDGQEEYTAVMRYQPIEFEVSFFIKAYKSGTKTAETVLREQIDAFFAKIRQGEFRIYDSYTGIGRRRVRYAGFSEDGIKGRDDWFRAIFKVKFKVNDPVTRMKLSGGKIVEQ